MSSVRHVYGFVIYVMKTFDGVNFIENTVCMHYDSGPEEAILHW